MDWCTIIISGLVIAIIALILRVTRNYGTLEALGIPVLKPFLCFGSPPLDWHNIVWFQWFHQQHQKYGLTFGSYNGYAAYINTIG